MIPRKEARGREETVVQRREDEEQSKRREDEEQSKRIRCNLKITI